MGGAFTPERRGLIENGTITEMGLNEAAGGSTGGELGRDEAACRSLVEGTEDCFVLVEPMVDQDGSSDDYLVLRVNEVWERHTGLRAADLVGRRIREFLPTMEHVWPATFAEVTRTGVSRHFECYNEDTGRWYGLNAFPYGNGQVGVLFRDITERVASEQRLRESEAKYRSLFESIDEGFCVIEVIFDRESRAVDYRFLEVNPAFEEQTGIKSGVGRLMRDIEPSHEEFWFETYGRVARTGRPERFIHEAKPLMGGWYDVFAFRVGGGGSNRVAIVFKDITEQKRTEETLKESESLYRMLFEKSDDGFQLMRPIYDDRGEMIDMRYVVMTPAAGRHTGLVPSEVIGKTAKEVVPNIEPSFFQFYGGIAKSGRSAHTEMFNQDTNRWYDILSFPATDGDIGLIFRDVTDRKRAEAALEKTQAFVQADLDAMTILRQLSALSLQEMSQETILREIVNAAMAITGADFGNIQILDESGDLVIVAQRGFPDWWVDYWNSIGNRQGSCGVTLREGRRVIVEDVETASEFAGKPGLDVQRRAGVRACESTPIMSRSGKPLGVFSTHYRTPHRPDERVQRLLDLLSHQAADIIERARAEEALRKAKEDLEVKVEERTRDLSHSNEELQQFAYVASHDLQEPLRMVTSYLGLLNKKFGEELPPQAKEYMSFAVDGSLRMRALINDLLAYSRVDTQGVGFTDIDMNSIAKHVTDDLRLAIRDAKAEIVIGPLPSVRGDRIQMRQLLTNLVSNAIKFRRPGVQPRIEVSAKNNGDENIFVVKDNGIGIDPKYEDKLFKMFSRLHTRDEYPGTGIGLAVAKKIVERHHGRIWFESEPGKGTTFYFTIPS